MARRFKRLITSTTPGIAHSSGSWSRFHRGPAAHFLGIPRSHAFVDPRDLVSTIPTVPPLCLWVLLEMSGKCV
ncbi:hypothetical protein PAPYR_2622 [Paratrimastix pyriformis]|uniref:Uncharacterized protein n=1 Tax=Paratrimastix pyriformis TaxID=342808 RepID=A0ABQ8UPR2_9EUKA|nr:hypothetical protein PAPYR_2622 [Paratrimastix pyriformis]